MMQLLVVVPSESWDSDTETGGPLEDAVNESDNRGAAVSKKRLWTGRAIGAWIVLFLVFDGAVKALKMKVAVDGTVRLGYPEHLIVPLGIVELACVAAYVFPRTAVIGAILLTGYLGGATATQLRLGDPWFLFPVAIGVVVWGALWLRNSSVGRLLF